MKGLGNIKRQDIPLYRYEEIRAAICAGETIFIVEGEPCADALWQLGIPATTNIGGAGKWQASDSQDLVGVHKVVLCPDCDQPGVKHTQRIATDFPQAQWLYAFPNSPFWHNLPPSQGLDVADWIQASQLSASDIWEAIEPWRQGLPNPEVPTSGPVVEQHYTQKCQAALYADKPWIALNNQLYYWTGTHYQATSPAQEKQRIAQWCNTTPVQRGKTLTYAYADSTHVENIWKWLLCTQGISPDEVNPPGINCLNGVVRIFWEGRHARWKLLPHDPEVVYTYVNDIEFDPDADPTDCERMLSCLEPAQQKLFLQTIAASLDLKTLRQYRGREVKALLCQGHGNNGKDTLREAVRQLYSLGMSNASVSDFAAYDQGRKFGLAKLEGTLINWSSENSSFNNLDRLQSLKAAITGEPLDLERKGVDERLMMLDTVFLFNVNEAPNLQAGMEAIQSRWAVLSFNKTYKVGADPHKGEIEADSRFRYDPNFLRKNVCPALLNKMLAALSTLAIDGIDYRCTAQALQDIQRETNHLWAFAQDIGLGYQVDGKIYIQNLWERLREWYLYNGTLEILPGDSGKEKKIWHDQPRRGDKNVKAPNQIYQRFAELFPKIKKGRDTSYQTPHTGQFYLSGLGIQTVQADTEAVKPSTEAITEAVEPSTEAVTEAITEAVSLTQSLTEATEAINASSADSKTKILRLISRLSQEDRSFIKSALLTEAEKNQLVTGVDSTASVASVPYPEGVTASVMSSVKKSVTSEGSSVDCRLDSKKDSQADSHLDRKNNHSGDRRLTPENNHSVNRRLDPKNDSQTDSHLDRKNDNSVNPRLTQDSSPSESLPTTVQWEPEMEAPEWYKTFPHRTSQDERAKKRQAIQIYRELLAAQTGETLQQIKAKRGKPQLLWVWNHMRTEQLQGRSNWLSNVLSSVSWMRGMRWGLSLRRSSWSVS